MQHSFCFEQELFEGADLTSGVGGAKLLLAQGDTNGKNHSLLERTSGRRVRGLHAILQRLRTPKKPCGLGGVSSQSCQTPNETQACRQPIGLRLSKTQGVIKRLQQRYLLFKQGACAVGRALVACK